MDEATITVNGQLVRLAQKTMLSIGGKPISFRSMYDEERPMATQTSTKMPVQFPLRPKPIKPPPKKGGK